jgi:class 3 adenylate cyclase
MCGVTTDIERFDALLAAARRERPTAALDLLDEALSLWRGDVLAEFEKRSWALPVVARLNEEHSAAVEDQADAMLGAGLAADAVSHMEEHTRSKPLRERSHNVLMRALHSQGRTAEALRVFQDYRGFLITQAGTAPSRELRALEQRLLTEQEDQVRPAPSRSAVLALLVIDIDRSTRLWAEHPDQMRECVEKHDSIVRRAYMRRRGRMFSTEGEGFHLAFENPGDACSVAVQLQDDFADMSWPIDASFSARMGIHLGLVSVRNNAYFGPAIEVADQVEAAAQGGQILVTSQVLEHVDGISSDLADLGFRRLPGVEKPVHVYQLNNQRRRHAGVTATPSGRF